MPSHMNIDNERLIGCVEAIPILWQVKHREYKNRPKKNALWLEVAAIVLPGAPDAAAGAVTVAHEDQHHQPPQKKKTMEVLFEQLGNVQKELTPCASKDIDENFAATLVAHMRTVQPEHKLDLQLKLLQVVKNFKTPAQ
ncbi:hypothetical protein MTO96_008129 [Rhipicephalus appendiculatus]